ncbi:hypothetical protein Mboo_2304 [Methanoregula boonei 6A8]|uniref:Uncharacterized protein n=1 Tax=Methanoregula boonei (strain DSM 21154 / JCM 14090 / 6A8) TaxID=456442 RepID=A7IAQ7_METB6|nr:hypothetical protein [Methanoregula boonei]ABS56818.1 hypothetical protein Mboo_2304 [Methanoregula boonei 6A8]
MQARIHGGRRRRSAEIPWLFVATIIGVVIVAGAAVLYFSGGSSSGHSSSDMVPLTPTPTGTLAATGTHAVVTSSTPVVIATSTPAVVSSTGVSISVSYIGGFNGTYNSGDGIMTVSGSGSKVYTVANATGTITATFQKTDSTATHPLSVSIYKNGQQLAIDNTSASYGKVTVSATV